MINKSINCAMCIAMAIVFQITKFSVKKGVIQKEKKNDKQTKRRNEKMIVFKQEQKNNQKYTI